MIQQHRDIAFEVSSAQTRKRSFAMVLHTADPPHCRMHRVHDWAAANTESAPGAPPTMAGHLVNRQMHPDIPTADTYSKPQLLAQRRPALAAFSNLNRRLV
jgi:hypothetical protein